MKVFREKNVYVRGRRQSSIVTRFKTMAVKKTHAAHLSVETCEVIYI